MSQPPPTSGLPRWLSIALVTLLTAQVGLLWTHGSLLQRQHEDIQGLREDVEALADDLYQDQDGWDSPDQDSSPRPSRMASRYPLRGYARREDLWKGYRHHPVRVARLQAPAAPGDADDAAAQTARQEVEASAQSAQQAVAKAQQVQSQLSLTENARKAEEQARKAGSGIAWMPWLWAGAAAAAALLFRWFRVRGRA